MIIKEITIDDTTADGFVFNNGYQETLENGKPNSEDKQAFIMRLFEQIVVANSEAYYANQAAAVARVEAISSARKSAVVTYEGKPKPTIDVQPIDVIASEEVIK